MRATPTWASSVLPVMWLSLSLWTLVCSPRFLAASPRESRSLSMSPRPSLIVSSFWATASICICSSSSRPTRPLATLRWAGPLRETTSPLESTDLREDPSSSFLDMRRSSCFSFILEIWARCSFSALAPFFLDLPPKKRHRSSVSKFLSARWTFWFILSKSSLIESICSVCCASVSAVAAASSWESMSWALMRPTASKVKSCFWWTSSTSTCWRVCDRAARASDSASNRCCSLISRSNPRAFRPVKASSRAVTCRIAAAPCFFIVARIAIIHDSISECVVAAHLNESSRPSSWTIPLNSKTNFWPLIFRSHAAT
mmetsp:Transcript_8508/g.27879  ORF Transcript_8508/g.27879 Transcript_8508/m.27879 type:complete len:314 (+) Transcript_8508:333-1274(+)